MNKGVTWLPEMLQADMCTKIEKYLHLRCVYDDRIDARGRRIGCTVD